MIELAEYGISNLPIKESSALDIALAPNLYKAAEHWDDYDFSSAANIYEGLLDSVLEELKHPEHTTLDIVDMHENALLLAELAVLARIWSADNYEKAYTAAKYLENKYPPNHQFNPANYYDLLISKGKYIDASRVAAILVILSTKDPIPYAITSWEESYAKAQYLDLINNPAKYADQAGLLLEYCKCMNEKYKNAHPKPFLINMINKLSIKAQR